MWYNIILDIEIIVFEVKNEELKCQKPQKIFSNFIVK